MVDTKHIKIKLIHMILKEIKKKFIMIFSLKIHIMREVISAQKLMKKLIKNIRKNIISIKVEIDIEKVGMIGPMLKLRKIFTVNWINRNNKIKIIKNLPVGLSRKEVNLIKVKIHIRKDKDQE